MVTRMSRDVERCVGMHEIYIQLQALQLLSAKCARPSHQATKLHYAVYTLNSLGPSPGGFDQAIILVKMAQDPREAFRRLQQTLQQRTRSGFGGSGGGLPGGASARPLAGLILLGLGGLIVSNALFNGMLTGSACCIQEGLMAN